MVTETNMKNSLLFCKKYNISISANEYTKNENESESIRNKIILMQIENTVLSIFDVLSSEISIRSKNLFEINDRFDFLRSLNELDVRNRK